MKRIALLAIVCASACSNPSSPPEDSDAGTSDVAAANDVATARDGSGDPGSDVPSTGDDGTDALGDMLSVPLVDQAELCDLPDRPRLSVAPGTDLLKVTLDDPLAVCNDGTPAVIYIRPGRTDRWVVWLEGGGGCASAEQCGDRWCGRHPIYSAAKMSSRWAPDGIRGIGIFDRSGLDGAYENRFGDFHHVVAYYCSSDTWFGTVRNEWNDETGRYPDFALHMKGHHIVNAMLAKLREGATSDDGSLQLPSLDDASQVLFMGTSAGGIGVRQNADRLGDELRRTNPGVDFRAVVDSVVHNREPDPPAITEERADEIADLLQAPVEQRNGVIDASCLEVHSDDPRRCAVATHVLLHHVTTPYFVKMDLTDNATSPGAYPDGPSFARANLELMNSLADVSSWSEENSSFIPGVFAPSCGHHVNLEANDFFRIGIRAPTGEVYNHHDILWNWLEGAEPQALVHDPSADTFSECP